LQQQPQLVQQQQQQHPENRQEAVLTPQAGEPDICAAPMHRLSMDTSPRACIQHWASTAVPQHHDTWPTKQQQQRQQQQQQNYAVSRGAQQIQRGGTSQFGVPQSPASPAVANIMLTVMYMQREDGSIQAYQQMPDGSLKPIRHDERLLVPDQWHPPALMQQHQHQQAQQQQLLQLHDEMGADQQPAGSRMPSDVFISEHQEQQQVNATDSVRYSRQQPQAPAARNMVFGEPEQQQPAQWQQHPAQWQQQQHQLPQHLQLQSQMVLLDESTAHASLQGQHEAQQVCSVMQGAGDGFMLQQPEQQGSLILLQQDVGHISLQQQLQQQQQQQVQQQPAAEQQQVPQQQQIGMMLPLHEPLGISCQQSPQFTVQQQIAVQQLQSQQLPGLHQQPSLLQHQQVEQSFHLQQVLQVQQPQQMQGVLPMQQTQHLQQVQQPQPTGLVLDAGAPVSASGLVLVPGAAVSGPQSQLRLLQQQLPGAVLGFAGTSVAMHPRSPGQLPAPVGQQQGASPQLLVPVKQLPLLPSTPVSGSAALQHNQQHLLQLPQLQSDEYAYLAQGLPGSHTHQQSSGVYSAAPWANLQAAPPQQVMPAAVSGQQSNASAAAPYVLAGSTTGGLQISSWQPSF
jgi:hypothetical protein